MEKSGFLKPPEWSFPPSVLDHLHDNTQYQALLGRHGIDEQAKSHFVAMVRELEPITGIHLKETLAS